MHILTILLQIVSTSTHASTTQSPLDWRSFHACLHWKLQDELTAVLLVHHYQQEITWMFKFHEHEYWVALQISTHWCEGCVSSAMHMLWTWVGSGHACCHRKCTPHNCQRTVSYPKHVWDSFSARNQVEPSTAMILLLSWEFCCPGIMG